MKILAIDQSSNISGWSYFHEKELIKYDLLDVSKCGKTINRISMIIKWIDWFIKNHEVDLIIFEDVGFQNESKYKQTQEYQENHEDRDNVATFQTLSKLLGVLEYHCTINNIQYQIKKPSAWRSSCGIKGTKRHEVKKNALDFVKKKWNLDIEEDIAEAICIGWSEVGAKNFKHTWGTFSK